MVVKNMKRVVRLNEAQLNRIVLNTAKRLIREGALLNAEDYDEDDVNEFARCSFGDDSDADMCAMRDISPYGSMPLYRQFEDATQESESDARAVRNFLDIYGNDSEVGIPFENDIFQTVADAPSMKDRSAIDTQYWRYADLNPSSRYVKAFNHSQGQPVKKSTGSYLRASDWGYNSRGYKSDLNRLLSKK